MPDGEREAAARPRGGYQLCPWATEARSRRVTSCEGKGGREEALTIVRRRVPVVIRGIQDGTEAQRRWSFEDLGARWGERIVPVVPLRDGMLSYGTDEGIAYVERRFGDVLADLDGAHGPGWYVSVAPDAYFPGLSAEARTPLHTTGATWRASRVWVGCGDTLTPIHHELTDNVLCVITGEKEVALFAPSARSRLRPNALWSGTPHLSRVDPRAAVVDDDTREAEVFRCTLRAGDSLFIPSRWWHVVRTTERSIAINYWWAKGLAATIPRAAELYKKVFRLST